MTTNEWLEAMFEAYLVRMYGATAPPRDSALREMLLHAYVDGVAMVLREMSAAGPGVPLAGGGAAGGKGLVH